MLKELLTGAAAGLLAFLLLTGYNVTPLILIGVLAAILYYFLEQRGELPALASPAPARPSVTFADIGGQATAARELKEALDFILQAEKVRELGIRPLRGILLTGMPGTGKTMLAKAAAAYTDAVFLSVSGSEFIEMYAGVGAQRVRNLFRRAHKLAATQKKNRAVIFIDEIECLGGKRGTYSAHQEYDQTLNQLLIEMDGVNDDGPVNILIIGATNRADLLDPALLRPGRFDRQVRVDLPDKQGRLEILQLHTAHKPLADDVDLEAVAGDTFGFSGAHLESLTNEAAILAMREGAASIGQRHLVEAIDKVMLGEKLGRRSTNEERYRVAVHETGHALTSEVLRPGSVSHLTITSRGQALGYTRQSPHEDIYLYTRGYLEDQVKIFLAGALAEELVLHSRSTGAKGDFDQALEVARQIIEAGLSDLGVVSWDDLPASARQKSLRQIITAQEARTRDILLSLQNLIKEIADCLLQQESIAGRYLRERLAQVRLEG